MARELSRTARDDGLTEVVVAVDNTTRHTILVPTSMMDQPGYQDMITLAGINHDRLVDIREGIRRL